MNPTNINYSLRNTDQTKRFNLVAELYLVNIYIPIYSISDSSSIRAPILTINKQGNVQQWLN